MRRSSILITVVVTAVLLSAGVALAATIKCDGGLCRGTNKADKMSGSLGRDRMLGRGGADIIRGNRGNDTMSGGIGADTMFGSYGNDRMFGGDGTDDIEGNHGNDYIVVAGDAANDIADCGPGEQDTVVIDAGEIPAGDLADFVAQSDCENVDQR